MVKLRNRISCDHRVTSSSRKFEGQDPIFSYFVPLVGKPLSDYPDFLHLQISDIMRDDIAKAVCLSRRLHCDFVWRHFLVCRQMSPCRLMCNNRHLRLESPLKQGLSAPC